MSTIYFTLTGICHRYGRDMLEPGMQVHLIKEPDNEYDREAIEVKMDGLGTVGYVANSVRTVRGESHSAGRLYDRIGDEAEGTVLYVLHDSALCQLNGSSIKYELVDVEPRADVAGED